MGQICHCREGGPERRKLATCRTGSLRQLAPQSVEFSLLTALLGRLQLASVPTQLARQVDGLLNFERGDGRTIRSMFGQQSLDTLLRLFGCVAGGERRHFT